jgi:hypothetical protein
MGSSHYLTVRLGHRTEAGYTVTATCSDRSCTSRAEAEA